MPLFAQKTLLVTSLFVAPDQTKTLNRLKRISAEHQHAGTASADGSGTLLCSKTGGNNGGRRRSNNKVSAHVLLLGVSGSVTENISVYRSSHMSG